MRTVFLGLPLALGLVLSGGPGLLPASLAGQESAEAVHGLNTAALVGQEVSVLPITMVMAEPALAADTAYAAYADRRAALGRADSLIAEAFLGRAPEVNWILPPELRKVARRAPGMVTDPDRMGQAVLRDPKLRRTPDPLRSSLRTLVAVAGGRNVLVPAALGYGRSADGSVRADLTLVLVDARTGSVLWRSHAIGQGAGPDAALNAALANVLPTTLQ